MLRIRHQHHGVSVFSVLRILLLLPIATKSFMPSLHTTFPTPHRDITIKWMSLVLSAKQRPSDANSAMNNNRQGQKGSQVWNNEIQENVKDCKSIQAVLDLCQKNNSTMSPTDVSFCWNQVSRFLSDYREVKKIKTDPRVLTPLLTRTIEACSKMNPRSLATTTHTIAKISAKARIITNKSSIWGIFEKRAIEMANLKSIEISNILWAFAKVRRKAPSLFDHLATQATENIQYFNSQDISNTLWSCAKAGHHSPALFDAAAGEVIKKIKTFNTQAISNTLWSYTTVGHASPELYDAAAGEVTKKLDAFTTQAISNILLSYARADHTSLKLFDAVAIEAIKRLGTFNSQAISNMLWSYATIGHAYPDLFEATAEEVIKKLPLFKSQEISNTLRSYARSGHVSPKLFDEAAAEAIRKLKTFNSLDISNMLWSYAKVGHRSPDLFNAAAKEAVSKFDTFNSQDISNTLWSLAVQDCNIESATLLLVRVLDLYKSNQLCLSMEGKQQMHQVVLWLSLEQNKKSPIPDDLANDCLSAFTDSPSNPSKLQTEAVAILRSLDFEVREDVICKKTGYMIDAVVTTKNGNELAVEVDDRVPTGSTVLKRRQLKNLGDMPLLSLQYWKWKELGSRDEKQNFLQKELDEFLS